MRLLLALALTLADPPPAAVPAPPTVAIDVIVRDVSNRPVEQLTPADLTVSEQGVPLTIESVRFMRTSGQPSSPAAAAATAAARISSVVPDAARVVAIYLDEFHVSPGSAADRVRDALALFVATRLGPADVVVVMKPLDSIVNIRVAGGRETAREAIQAFAPRQGDYAPRTPFERNFIAGAPGRIDAARAQITASSLHALVKALGAAAPARKTLIVVSDGFSRPSPGAAGVLPGIGAVSAAANRAHVSIYPIVVDSVEADASDSSDTTRDNRDAMLALATDTAGRVIAQSSLAAGLHQALDDASGYFLVTLERTAAGDGRFHGVDVSTRRAGLTTYTRKAYWAPGVEERRAALGLDPASTSRRPPVPRRTSLLIRPWFGMSPEQGGRTRVDFAWEPSPANPGARGARQTPARVALSVTAPDGTSVFEGTVSPSTSGSADVSSKAPARISFESQSGRLLVQMVIEDAAAQVLDHDVRDLIVDRFNTPIAMGTAEVLRARTIRDRNRLAAQPDAAPVAARQFSRAERLLIRVPVSSAAEAPVVSGRLVSDFGAVLRELVAAPMTARQGVYQFDLPLAALASGGYAVELKAVSPDGEASERVAFRVTP